MTPFSFSLKDHKSIHNELILTSGREFRFNIEEYVRYFSKSVSPRLIDLLRIAAAIYFADRLVRRKGPKNQQKWSRMISLNIGVIDPDFWNSPSIQHLLVDCIDFLSDDDWSIDFCRDDRRAALEVQSSLLEFPASSHISLASGGLDSVAGLGVTLANEPIIMRLPVTVWHQPIQRGIVLSQHQILAKRFGTIADPLIIKTALIWTPELKRYREEKSQRSRAFLFTAAGAVAAAMIGSSVIDVFESGIGAVNLPLMAGMVGSRTTRSCHPGFHERMGKLVSEVCGYQVKIDLPFFRSTKGEVVKELLDHGLSELARLSVSCVHYPLREVMQKQCGTCPACILRRQSLMIAGIQEPLGIYKYDLFDSSLSANVVPEKELDYLIAFMGQIVQLNSIQDKHSLPPRIRRHLFGTEIISEDRSVETVIQLFQRYRSEWLSFIAQARARGISWTNMIATTDNATEGATRAIA